MRKLIALVCVVMLSGCALQPKIIKEQVIVKVPCIENQPIRPESQFKKLPRVTTTQEAAEAVRQLYLDAKAWEAYGLEWETEAAGCVTKEIANEAK